MTTSSGGGGRPGPVVDSSAGVVGSMPLILGMVLNYMRPDLMQPMLDHIFGYVLVGAIVVMEVLGMLIIRRIVNIDI